VVADGEPLEITKAMTSAQDAQHGNQEQVPGWDADPTTHPGFRDGPQKADQVKISCGSSGFEQRKVSISPRRAQATCSGQTGWDTP